MTSAIDATKPITGAPTTASVRANFATAKQEITDLQEAVANMGPGGAGGLAQQVTYASAAVWTTATSLPADDTIPQNTEGGEFGTVTITPTAADSILEIESLLCISPNATAAVTAALFQDTTANAIAAIGQSVGADNNAIIALKHYVAATSIDARTYKLRAGQSASGTCTINGWGGNRRLGGVMASYLTVREWLAA
jgi:hypothetical protein